MKCQKCDRPGTHSCRDIDVEAAAVRLCSDHLREHLLLEHGLEVLEVKELQENQVEVMTDDGLVQPQG